MISSERLLEYTSAYGYAIGISPLYGRVESDVWTCGVPGVDTHSICMVQQRDCLPLVQNPALPGRAPKRHCT